MYAVRRISFSKCDILTTGTVLRVNMHHRAEFDVYRTIDCKDMAICKFFKMASVRHLEFSNVQNFDCRWGSKGQYTSSWQISVRHIWFGIGTLGSPTRIGSRMRNGYVADDLGWPLTTLTKHPQFLHFALPYACIFVVGDRKDSKFDVQVECSSHNLRSTNRPW